MRFALLGSVGWGREPGWCEGQEGGRGGPWEPSLPTLPRPAPPVGRQESRHLLRKLSDDDHHLVAPERQRGPRVQRLRPLLQAAQRERPRPSLGTSGFVLRGAAWAAIPGVAWLGKRAPEGLPTRGAACWRTPPWSGISAQKQSLQWVGFCRVVGVGGQCPTGAFLGREGGKALEADGPSGGAPLARLGAWSGREGSSSL